jgi:hypothetical protein
VGEKGERLKSIIERLNHQNPEMRMHHSDAARLMEVFNDKAKYDEVNASVDSKLSAQRASVEQEASKESAHQVKKKSSPFHIFHSLLGSKDKMEDHLSQPHATRVVAEEATVKTASTETQAAAKDVQPAKAVEPEVQAGNAPRPGKPH